MSTSSSPYRRPHAAELARRLAGPRRHIQVVAGPRQVGKYMLVQQIAEDLAAEVARGMSESLADDQSRARASAKAAMPAGISRARPLLAHWIAWRISQ